MSIYHHFPNKAHLMDALVDLMLAEARVAEAGEGDWLERLRRTAHSFRAMALKHPKFFPFFAVHRLNTRAGVAFVDGVIGILREAGFSDGDAARYFRETRLLPDRGSAGRNRRLRQGTVGGRAGVGRHDRRGLQASRGGGALLSARAFPGDVRDGAGNPAGGDPAGATRGRIGLAGDVIHLLNGSGKACYTFCITELVR